MSSSRRCRRRFGQGEGEPALLHADVDQFVGKALFSSHLPSIRGGHAWPARDGRCGEIRTAPSSGRAQVRAGRAGRVYSGFIEGPLLGCIRTRLRRSRIAAVHRRCAAWLERLRAPAIRKARSEPLRISRAPFWIYSCHHGLVVDTAHAGELAVALAGREDLVDRRLHAGMAQLVRHAEFRRHVGAADQQRVDAGHGGDFVNVVQAFGVSIMATSRVSLLISATISGTGAS